MAARCAPAGTCPLSHDLLQLDGRSLPGSARFVAVDVSKLRNGAYRGREKRKGKGERKRRCLTPPAQRVDARLQTAPARRSKPANRPSCVATSTTIASPAMAATMEPFCTFCFDTA